MNESIVSITAAILSAGATLLAVWLKHRWGAQRCDPLTKEMQQNANVYMALEHTLEKTGADRAYVLEFHNGENYFSGRGQQKFSCTHEVVRQGISAESANSQNYRVSNFHHYINTLVQDGEFNYANLDSLEDYAFIKLLEHKGVQSIYNVTLTTLSGKIIGIVGVDYVRHKGPQEKIGFNQTPNGSLTDFLKVQSKIIAGYLV